MVGTIVFFYFNYIERYLIAADFDPQLFYLNVYDMDWDDYFKCGVWMGEYPFYDEEDKK